MFKKKIVSVLHISDLHLDEFIENQVKSKFACICNLLLPKLEVSGILIIIISGDLTNNGKKLEFERLKRLLDYFKSSIIKQKAMKIHIVSTPGNHDLDFSVKNDLRDYMLSAPVPAELPHDVAKVLAKPLENYFSFESQNGNEWTKWICSKQRFEISNDLCLQIDSLNTCLYTKIKENKGTLEVSDVLLKELNEERVHGKRILKFCVFHHPFSWLSHDSAYRLKDYLAENYNAYFQGHEHIAESETIQRDGVSKIIQFQGKIFSHKSDVVDSGFIYQQINVNDLSYTETRYVWNADAFVEQLSLSGSFENEQILAEQKFIINTEFLKKISIPESPIRHPKKENVKQNDLFVYPDIFAISYSDKNFEVKKRISFRDIASVDNDDVHAIVIGEEKSGKSTLAKQLFFDLIAKGKVPVLCNAASSGKSIVDKQDERIKHDYCKQYITRYADYENAKYENKVLIIDNLNSVGSSSNVIKTLNIARNRYKYVFAFVKEEFWNTEFVMPKEQANEMSNWDHYKIRPLGKYLRYELMERWIRLNNDLPEEQVELRINSIQKTMDQITEIKILSPYPFFVLTLLQSLEAGSGNELRPSYVHYYEYLISDAINRVAEREDLDLIVTYSMLLAWKMYESKKSYLTNLEMAHFHNWYLLEKLLNTPITPVIELLKKCLILAEDENGIYFKYRHTYLYYVSRYACNVIRGTREYKAMVTDLCSKLYLDESVSLLMFITMNSKDELVIDEIVEKAMSTLSSSKEFDCVKDSSEIDELCKTLPKIILPDNVKSENRKESLKIHDEIDPESLDEKKINEKHEDVDPDNLMDNVNVGLREIQILGQILKTYSASLDAGNKKMLAGELFSLPLRIMNGFFEIVSVNMDALVVYFAKMMEDKGDVDEGKSKARAQRFMFFICQVFAFSIIKKTSVFGSEKQLVPVYEAIRGDGFENDTKEILSLAMRIACDHNIQTAKVEELARKYKRNMFAFGLLRNLVYDHMYLYPMDLRKEQKLCSILEISQENKSELNAKRIGR